MLKNECRVISAQWSAAETNGDTKTLGDSHVHNVKPTAKRVNIERLIFREPVGAIHLSIIRFI